MLLSKSRLFQSRGQVAVIDFVHTFQLSVNTKLPREFHDFIQMEYFWLRAGSPSSSHDLWAESIRTCPHLKTHRAKKSPFGCQCLFNTRVMLIPFTVTPVFIKNLCQIKSCNTAKSQSYVFSLLWLFVASSSSSCWPFLATFPSLSDRNCSGRTCPGWGRISIFKSQISLLFFFSLNLSEIQDGGWPSGWFSCRVMNLYIPKPKRKQKIPAA